jgi:hypothetical protein
VRPVSARFLNALSGSTLTAARVRPCNPTVRGGDGLIAPSGPALPLLDGQLTLDGTADERGRLEITVGAYWPDSGQDGPTPAGSFATGVIGSSPAATTRPGQPVWPINHKAPLTPYGKLLLVEAGQEYGNGDVEYVRLGYYRVEDMEQAEEPDGPIVIQARDLMSFLIDGRMVYEQTFPAGTTMATLFQQLVIDNGSGYRGMPQGWTTSDLDLDPTFAAMTLGATRTTEGDRFAFLADQVNTRGYIWYWDGRGKLVVSTAPDPTQPVADIGGPAGAALTSSGRRINRDGTYNVVIADSSAIEATPAVRYVAFNADPTTPSYLHWYGWTPRFYSSPQITDDASAGVTANTLLAASRGVPNQRAARHNPNAALEPNDPLRIWPRGSTDPLGYEVRVLEKTTIPLVPGRVQETTTRELRLG